MTALVYAGNQSDTRNHSDTPGSECKPTQRQHEVQLMRFCFDKLGLPVIGAVEAPGYLEGRCWHFSR